MTTQQLRRFTVLLTAFCICCVAPRVEAQVATTGDVSPKPSEDGDRISGALTVGQGNTAGDTTVGTVSIGGIEFRVGSGVIGNQLNAVGIVDVFGGATWEVDGDATVGNDGSGELYVSSRGFVDVDDDLLIGSDNDGRGWVSVQDAATVLAVGQALTVGQEGVGRLSVSNAARVFSNSGVVGSIANSAGVTEVTDQASWRIQGDLVVGDAGNGSLRITSGGLVESTNAILADTAGGTGSALVEGAGTRWLSRDDLTVGDANSAEIDVNDDGTVQVNDALSIRRRGAVRMDGGNLIASSIANSGVIAGSGFVSGDVTNAQLGSIQANDDQPLVFSSEVTNNGTIDAIDGHIQFQRLVTNGDTGLISGRDGVVRFDAGLLNEGRLGFTAEAVDVFGDIANTADGSIQVAGGGTVTFHGAVTSAGPIRVEDDSHAVFLGDVSNSATSALRVDGVQAASEAAGEPVPADRLVVQGAVQFDGVLSVFPSEDVEAITEPTSRGTETSFGLASAESIDGQFTQFNYAGSELTADFPLDDGRSFRSHDGVAAETGIFRTLAYTSTSLDVVNYWALQGDTDGDQDVDFADFLVVSGNFGMAGDWTDGDFDGDGLVAFGDFLQLSDNFGAVAVAAAAVPEPKAGLLGMIAVGCAFVSQRRRRR